MEVERNNYPMENEVPMDVNETKATFCFELEINVYDWIKQIWQLQCKFECSIINSIITVIDQKSVYEPMEVERNNHPMENEVPMEMDLNETKATFCFELEINVYDWIIQIRQLQCKFECSINNSIVTVVDQKSVYEPMEVERNNYPMENEVPMEMDVNETKATFCFELEINVYDWIKQIRQLQCKFECSINNSIVTVVDQKFV